MEIAKLVSWQYVLCKLGEMIRETKKTGMNLQNVPLTYQITDTQVKNTTTWCNITVKYIWMHNPWKLWIIQS